MKTEIHDSNQPIRPIPEQFPGRGEVKGFLFTQICSTDHGFCYEVTQDGIKPYFEVFRRKINKWFNCESYPSAKAFGTWAWTFLSKSEALQKLEQLAEPTQEEIS